MEESSKVEKMEAPFEGDKWLSSCINILSDIFLDNPSLKWISNIPKIENVTTLDFFFFDKHSQFYSWFG